MNNIKGILKIAKNSKKLHKSRLSLKCAFILPNNCLYVTDSYICYRVDIRKLFSNEELKVESLKDLHGVGFTYEDLELMSKYKKVRLYKDGFGVVDSKNNTLKVLYKIKQIDGRLWEIEGEQVIIQDMESLESEYTVCKDCNLDNKRSPIYLSIETTQMISEVLKFKLKTVNPTISYKLERLYYKEQEPSSYYLITPYEPYETYNPDIVEKLYIIGVKVHNE